MRFEINDHPDIIKDRSAYTDYKFTKKHIVNSLQKTTPEDTYKKSNCYLSICKTSISKRIYE